MLFWKTVSSSRTCVRLCFSLSLTLKVRSKTRHSSVTEARASKWSLILEVNKLPRRQSTIFLRCSRTSFSNSKTFNCRVGANMMMKTNESQNSSAVPRAHFPYPGRGGSRRGRKVKSKKRYHLNCSNMSAILHAPSVSKVNAFRGDKL